MCVLMIRLSLLDIYWTYQTFITMSIDSIKKNRDTVVFYCITRIHSLIITLMGNPNFHTTTFLLCFIVFVTLLALHEYVYMYALYIFILFHTKSRSAFNLWKFFKNIVLFIHNFNNFLHSLNYMLCFVDYY